MYTKKLLAVLMIFAYMLYPGQAEAQVSQKIEYKYYRIWPEAGRDLVNSAFAATPIEVDGKKYLGHTYWQIAYNYRNVQSSIGICRTKEIQVTCSCLITLPKLQSSDSGLNRAFDGYVEKLKKHELEHCRLSTEYAGKFYQYALGVKNQKCEQFDQVIRGKYDTLVNELKSEQKRYDQRTKHGKTEGADLKMHLNDTSFKKTAPKLPPAQGRLISIDPEVEDPSIRQDSDGVWRNY